MEEEEDYESPEFKFDDYIELPDGRCGYVCGFFSHKFMRGEIPDEIAIVVKLEGVGYKRITVWRFEDWISITNTNDTNDQLFTDDYRGVKIIKRKGE